MPGLEFPPIAEGQQAKVAVNIDPLSPQALQREAVQRVEQLDKEIEEIQQGIEQMSVNLERRRTARQAIAASLAHLSGPEPDEFIQQ